MTKRRLSADDRRTALLEVAAELFTRRPYEDVSMEEAAALAGISRALLYRHFPSKRELFAAVYRQASDQLLAQTAPDPNVPLGDQIDAGLDAYIEYFAEHSNIVLTANRNLAGDPEIQDILQSELEVLRERIVAFIGSEEPSGPAAAAALMGWLRFAHTACAEWLTTRAFSRDELKQMCLGALLGALGPSLNLSQPGDDSQSA